MALADLVVPRQRIAVGAGGFDVRGLSAFDINQLVNERFNQLVEAVQVYDEFDANAPADPLDDVDTLGKVLSQLIRNVPDLIAAVICMAADEPGNEDTVQKLPVGVQVNALMAVGQLTFEEVGGAKKFLTQVIGLLADARVAIESQQTNG